MLEFQLTDLKLALCNLSTALHSSQTTTEYSEVGLFRYKCRYAVAIFAVFVKRKVFLSSISGCVVKVPRHADKSLITGDARSDLPQLSAHSTNCIQFQALPFYTTHTWSSDT